MNNKDMFFKMKNSKYAEIDSVEKFCYIIQHSMHVKDYLFKFELLDLSTKSVKVENITFENCSFSKKTIQNTVLVNCKFIDCLFINTKIMECEFQHCIFINCNTFKIQIDKTIINPKSFQNVQKDYKNKANIALALFQQLKNNSSSIGNAHYFQEASYWYNYWTTRQLHYSFQKKHIQLIPYIFFLVTGYLYEKSAGYGYRVFNFTITTICFFLLLLTTNYYYWESLGICNILNDANIKIVDDNNTLFIKTLYFTFVSIQSLGSSYLVPLNTIGIVLSIFESITGIIWLSILASMLFKKIGK